jgi:putative oxidoreductase
MKIFAELGGRILLAQIFLLAGINKIVGYESTQAYMEAMGVPGMLLPLVILLEIGGALMLIIGWQLRGAAVALAVFSILAGLIFHSNFADQMQMIMFMKNLAIAGGLLILAAHGSESFTLARKLALWSQNKLGRGVL